MIFHSASFILFFVVLFALYWGLGIIASIGRSPARPRIFLLLVASYFFYACWNPYFLSLIALSTAIDYIVGRSIQHSTHDRSRKILLCVSMVTNLSILATFKYANFFIESAQDLLETIGVHPDPIVLNIVLPVGISFYTFQSMSYTIDVYRKHIEAERDPIRFALFVAFFPQLVAGPIVRAADFLPQTHQEHRIRTINFDFALGMILRGLAKKILLADALAPFVDQVFANPADYGTVNIWLAAISYGFQIYGDFSGYSDIAIGVAALLGYRLPRNFCFPYLAVGFSDFWRRWHISLSTWLRDYLYISLGGNRLSPWLTYRNLLITMVLGGLWHGASYTFLAWGALHGLLLVTERLLKGRFSLWQRSRIIRLLGSVGIGVLTYAFVHIAWVLFRAETIQIAFFMIGRMLVWIPDAEVIIPPYLALLLFVAIASHIWGEYAHRARPKLLLAADRFTRPVQYAALAVFLFLAHNAAETAYIYFQF